MRSEKAWVSTCYVSFGRDVSGLAGKDARRRSRTAAWRRATRASACTASRATSRAPTPAERAGRFCARAPSRYQAHCYEGVGSVLGSIETTPEALRARCREVGGRHVHLPARRGPRAGADVATAGTQRAIAWVDRVRRSPAGDDAAAAAPDPLQHRQPARQRARCRKASPPTCAPPASRSTCSVAEPERPNLVARLRGNADGPVLCLLSHIDTCWRQRGTGPRSMVGRPRRRLSLGRGALDMKSRTDAEVAAALSLAR